MPSQAQEHTMEKKDGLELNRRDLLKLGTGVVLASAAGLSTSAPAPAEAGQLNNTSCAGTGYIEVSPVSPRILNPFTDELPIPAPMQPVSLAEMTTNHPAPGAGVGQQDSDGGTHEIWPNQLGLPDPLLYRIKLEVAAHSFTSSLVQPIGVDGTAILPPDGIGGPRNLPQS